MRTAVIDRPITRPSLLAIALTSFVPPDMRGRAIAWVQWMPITAIVLLQVGLSVRLSNTAFQDEALYILAGRDYLDNWFSGAPVDQAYGDYFSGVPVLYPVVAGALDHIGGLLLVRAFSLLLMVGAMLCVRATSQHMWGERAATLTALAFVLVGPVMFVGWFATFDAACIAAIAAALWLGVTHRSYTSAVLAGLALALAGLLKYTGVAFIPIVLAVIVATAHRRVTRAATAGAVATGTLGLLYLLFGGSVRNGILFTTASRHALWPDSTSHLLQFLLLDVGLVLALALLAVYVVGRSGSFRCWLLLLALLSGAVLLPAGQIRLGESVSFEKHLAYSALFLAPLAGRGLLAMPRRAFGVLFIAASVWVVGTTGLSRSHAMYQWPDVDRVARLAESVPAPGHYLSTASELEYYTLDHPKIRWDSEYSFLDSGRAQMRAAVERSQLQFVALRKGRTGNVKEDKGVAFMIRTLDQSPNYHLVAKPFPIMPYSTDTWRVYRLVTPRKG